MSKIGSLNCPIVVCQGCNKRIEDVGWGIVLWNYEEDEGVVVHKSCDVNRSNRYEMSEELNDFYWSLLFNSGLKNPNKDLKEPIQI